jgi:glucokinase
MSYSIGFDLGGTNIVCGLLDGEHRLVGTLKRPTQADQGFEHVIGRMAELANDLMGEKGVDRADVEVVGAGVPGLVDPVRGVVMGASNLGWRDVPAAEELGRRLGLPVYIDNDVRMYVYGEAVAGAGRGFRVVLGLTVGTGLAAALVEDGRLYFGGGFMAGELGHIRMDDVPYRCGCGLVGCLETVVSATGIARLARDRIAAGGEGLLARQFAGRLQELAAADVSAAHEQGDALAAQVMDEVGRYLGRGLSYAVTLLSPDLILIGGGVAAAGEKLFAPMRSELKRLVLPPYWQRLTIRRAELLDDAGVIGSAASAVARIREGGAS